MSFNFVIPEMNIGGNGNSPFVFYKRGFVLGNGATPEWRDIILSGNTALTLVNAKADGLNYLKLFGKCEQRNLPSGFTQVEYLQSSGEEYIDLGDVLDTSTDDIEIEFQLLQTETATNFFGARYSTTRYVYTLATNGEYWRWGWKNNSNTSDVSADLNKHVLRVNHTNNTLSLDGVVIETKGSAVTNIETPTSATLFCIHTAGTQTFYLGAVRISAFRKWRNGELVQSVVSCRRNSDNVLGMLDLVTDTFFTNAGTGTFTSGADIPTPNAPMDIVCNNGVVKVSENLFDESLFNIDVGTTVTYRQYQIPNGIYTMSTNFPPQPNTQYTNVWIMAGKQTEGQSSTENGVSLGYPKTITVTDGWYTIFYRSTNENIPPFASPSADSTDFLFLLQK